MVDAASQPEIYAVFEGGGVKGFALVGALARVQEEKQITIKGFAGASAGAIVAALAAAGYQALDPTSAVLNPAQQTLNRIMEEMQLLNFLDGQQEIPLLSLEQEWYAIVPTFRELAAEVVRYPETGWRNFLRRICSLWRVCSLARQIHTQSRTLLRAGTELEQRRGIYGTDSFTQWLRGHLQASGFVDPASNVTTFGVLLALRETVLKIVATNVATGGLRVYDPELWADMEVASAVRASMSIPLFFHPVLDDVQGCLLVDGGMISNFPAAVFSKERQEGARVIGFRLVRPSDIPQEPLIINNLEEYLGALYRILRESEDPVKTEGARKLVDVIIEIPIPYHYTATKFELTDAERQELFNLGYRTAHQAMSVPANRQRLGL